MEHTDTERLDWMIANHASFGSFTRMEVSEYTGEATEWTRLFVRVGCTLMYEWHCFDGATPREAIDNAMAAPGCSGEWGDCRSSARLWDRHPNRTLETARGYAEEGE